MKCPAIRLRRRARGKLATRPVQNTTPAFNSQGTSTVGHMDHLPAAGTILVNTATASARLIQAMYRNRVKQQQTQLDTAATEYESAISEPTPPEDWFTPFHGWPKHLLRPRKHWFNPPVHLTPTAAEAPALFTDEATAAVIGEIEIEVLEAEGLPDMNKLCGSLKSGDPYALILFENHAARSNTCRNTRAPRWLPGHSARAFRFPVTCPYSMIYIGLKDDDLVTADSE